MGLKRPDTVDIAGDESVLSPRQGSEAILVTERGTDKTKRVESDTSGNLFVNVAAGGSGSDPKTTGTWSYYAGVSGAVSVSAGQRVIGIAAHSTSGGTVSINGGPSIPLPATISVAIAPVGNLVAPSIVFTGTDTYMVEVVS